MKTKTKLFIGSILTIALALAIGTPDLSQSAEPAEDKAMMPGEMPTCCVEMKAKCQTMWDDLKAEDVKLSKQVAKMNSASKDKKMALMAALITRMVEQRTATNVRMAKTQEGMMKHMMQCPMMMGMKNMSKKPAVARSEHLDHPK